MADIIQLRQPRDEWLFTVEVVKRADGQLHARLLDAPVSFIEAGNTDSGAKLGEIADMLTNAIAPMRADALALSIDAPSEKGDIPAAINVALDAIVAASPPSGKAGETLAHTRSCAALGGFESDCSCCLKWRMALATEQEMHAAWRKRAEEAEAALASGNAGEWAVAWRVRFADGRCTSWFDGKPPNYHGPYEFAYAAPPQPAPDALREALTDAMLHLEDAQSGFISGCGSNTAWLNKRDEIVNAARAALSTPNAESTNGANQ